MGYAVSARLVFAGLFGLTPAGMFPARLALDASTS